MATFKVVLRGPNGTRENVEHKCDDVHITVDGNVKLLNKIDGKPAELVAFYNAMDVVSCVREEEQA